jgi:hypothetical protein|tara:strand:+ start:1905 stop:2450 length:546 start_codon:yes stop_codon:yes gene_type:complete
MEMNKIQALSAPPGHSLTDAPGKWAWEKPAQFTDPNDAVDFVIDKMKIKNTQEDMIKMMAAGITIEELVGQVAFKGFMQGMYSPDVAELIKAPIGVYLMKLALDNDIEPELTVPNRERDEGQVTDDTFFEVLQERNPSMYTAMLETANEQSRMADRDLADLEIEEEIASAPLESFLEMGDQ